MMLAAGIDLQLQQLAAPQARRVYAVDFAEAMLGQLRARAAAAGITNVEARVADGQALPFDLEVVRSGEHGVLVGAAAPRALLAAGAEGFLVVTVRHEVAFGPDLAAAIGSVRTVNVRTLVANGHRRGADALAHFRRLVVAARGRAKGLRAGHRRVEERREGSIVVRLSRSGSVSVEGRPVAVEDLGTALVRERAGREKSRVIVYADRDVECRALLDAIVAMRGESAVPLVFAVDRAAPGSEREESIR